MGNMEGGQPGSVWELALNVNAAKGKAVQKKNIKYLKCHTVFLQNVKLEKSR